MPVSERFVLATLLLLFLLQPLLLASASVIDDAEDDLEGLEELLAIDLEEEQEKGAGGGTLNKLSEAKILLRAQKIVVELGNENAEKVVRSSAAVLLLGYTPWCPKSAELMPKFVEAATVLREMGSNLVVAKLDAERHEKAANLLGIKGFPTILLFIDGSPLIYRGGFTKEEILIWVRKKTGAPVIRLSSLDVAEDFLRQHQTFIIGHFENYEGPEYDEFVKAAATDNEIQFVETIDNSIAMLLFPDVGLDKRFIGLVKSEPERFEKFDDNFEEHKILQFIEYNKFPLITELTEQNSVRVYSSAIKLQVFIFVGTTGDPSAYARKSIMKWPSKKQPVGGGRKSRLKEGNRRGRPWRPKKQGSSRLRGVVDAEDGGEAGSGGGAEENFCHTTFFWVENREVRVLKVVQLTCWWWADMDFITVLQVLVNGGQYCTLRLCSTINRIPLAFHSTITASC